MAPALVMDHQIARKPGLPFLGGLEGHSIAPLPAEGLDEPRQTQGVWYRRCRHVPMPLLVAGCSGGAFTMIAGDAVAIPFEPGQLLRFDVDHVGQLLLLAPLHWRLGNEGP